MAAIRKSGGVNVFFWDGKVPDPGSADFLSALSERRFRTIEHAASEEVSVGWVTPGDPTGDSFDAEDMDGGTGTWLRLRIDKKALLMRWLQIHRSVAEKARGKKLSARERRELKDDLTEKLLPRVLPAITLVDALLFHDRRTVLLFATGKGPREAFSKLFFESFALPLERGDPLTYGLRAGLGAAGQHRLDQLEPVRWPRTGEAAAPTPAPKAAAQQEAEA